MSPARASVRRAQIVEAREGRDARWLERYITERTPTLKHFAEITEKLAELDGMKALP